LYPEVIGGVENITPELFDGTPWRDGYDRTAPDPSAFPTLVEKLKQLDMTVELMGPIDELAVPALIIIGDSDGTRLQHAVAMFRQLGGGVFGDLAPNCRPSSWRSCPARHTSACSSADWTSAMVTTFLATWAHRRSSNGDDAYVTERPGFDALHGLHPVESRPFVAREVGGSGGMPDVQTLMTGLVFGEQPRWHGHRLWFSDWGTREVIAVDLEGNAEVILEGPSFPLCVGWLPDGRLLVVSARDGLLLRRESDGALVTCGDRTGVSDPPAGNELVVDGRGNAYVNGGGFDLMAGEDFAPGIIALATPDGSARQVADGIAFPNGMVVSPDDSTLIVAGSYAKRLTAFDTRLMAA
jgi:hypothetical protein